MVARAINNDTTRRFVDVIDYLVDGVEAGDNELNIPLLREKLEKGIALRTKECACEWAGPEEDAGLGILKAIGEYLDENEFIDDMEERIKEYRPLDTTNLTLKEEDFSDVSE